MSLNYQMYLKKLLGKTEGTELIEVYNKGEKKQIKPETSEPYKVTVKQDYHLNTFIALYNDFSNNPNTNELSVGLIDKMSKMQNKY